MLVQDVNAESCVLFRPKSQQTKIDSELVSQRSFQTSSKADLARELECYLATGGHAEQSGFSSNLAIFSRIRTARAVVK